MFNGMTEMLDGKVMLDGNSMSVWVSCYHLW